MEKAIVNICLYGSYILVTACLVGWLVFIVRKLILNPRSLQNMMIMFGTVIVLYFIGSAITPEMKSQLSDTFIADNGLDQSTFNTVNGLYFSSILGLIVTFTLMIGGEILSIFRR